MKTSLRLNADQEKLWGPFESAVRDGAKARVVALQKEQGDNLSPMDRLNATADRLAQSAANLKKIVEAANPLYASLDDAQKHKFITLSLRRQPWNRPSPFPRGREGRDDRGAGIRRGRRSREIRRANVSQCASRYSTAAIVSRAIRARALICLFRASVSAEQAPCFRAFLLPLGAPPPAPCIRQTLAPRTAGARPSPKLVHRQVTQRDAGLGEHERSLGR